MSVDPTEVAKLQGEIVGSIYEREIARLENALKLIVAGRQLGPLDFKDHAISIALEALRDG
jgi:hypothetical protein